jgi:PAS domain S-box-containing protein
LAGDFQIVFSGERSFLAGGGDMAARIAGHDWSASLGPLDSWPQSLKTTVGLMIHSPVALVLLWGPDGIMLYNDAYGVFAGNRHPGLLGMKVLEAWPEAADLNAEVMAVCMAGGMLQFKDQELTLNRTGTPERGWMDLFYSPVMDESGSCGGVIAVVVETTAQVKIARDLAEREQRLQTALSAARIGTWDYNPVTGALMWDARCKALFGLPADASITWDVFLSGLHPDDRAHTEQAVQSALDPDGPGGYDVEYRTIGLKDGVMRWIAATGRAVFENRQPVRFIGTVMDISAQRKASGLLRDSEAQFHGFAQAMPNHVWAATPDGQLDWFNEQVYRFTGLPFAELEGERWAAAVHPDDLLATALRWSDALKSGETYQAEFRLRNADGVYRWHVARAVPIRDDAGAVTRWIGTNTDIHEQAEVTEALRDLTETLEQRVRERTGQLMQAEEALRQAQKMEAVGQLTGGIAHDFNNLLQGITGALDRVQHRIAQGRPADADRFIKAAVESANRAAALTHRLLAFSRRQTLDPRPTDANRLIAGMEDLVRRTMGPNVAIEVVGAGGLWPVRVDPSQLENSLLNLCINARDAMPNGGTLTIETANKWLDERAAKDRELPPGQYVSLCVTDTGSGMSPDVIARAFDPFFTTKPLGQGTGLGLSMIYGFVRQSGGQVRIYSEADKGTTMCLYFPRHMGKI